MHDVSLLLGKDRFLDSAQVFICFHEQWLDSKGESPPCLRNFQFIVLFTVTILMVFQWLLFQLYRSSVMLVLIHMYMYGADLYFWRRLRINYAFIFEFSPGTELGHREVLMVTSVLTTVLIGSMVGHLALHSAAKSPYVDFIPLGLVLVGSNPQSDRCVLASHDMLDFENFL